ncbi:MAG: ADP-ribosylglycohydrolase family protein [Tannerella sp.]|nr:ADP-ribosylglycohydrolase family protein [Tannerella sp.]
MKNLLVLLALLITGCSSLKKEEKSTDVNSITLSKEALKDKIKGAWAAQTIGVTFGIPAEFKYNSTMIQDNRILLWNDSSMMVAYRNNPGAYDDVYMDLTFMKVIEEKGIDATAQAFAEAFANADYKLWFANQTARYNILNGLTPPESGHWLNNPCADCNPGTAGAVLAAIAGYKNIPDFWKQGLNKIENFPFMGTTVSLLDAYDMSYRHAEEMIKRNGGEIKENEVVIRVQEPETVPLEVAFKGHYPVGKVVPRTINNEIVFEFEGIGFALAAPADGKGYKQNYVFETEMYIDSALVEKVKLPTEINKRRFTPFWKYQLPKGKHKVVIKILNPVDFAQVNYLYAVIYGDQPFEIKL